MNKFDQFMKHQLRIKYYVRYADDFVILSHDKIWLKNLIPKISEFLQNLLKLNLHPDKVFIKTLAAGVDWLGWVRFPHHRVLRTVTKKRMLKKLLGNPSEQTQQSYWGLLQHGQSYKLRQYIKGVGLVVIFLFD